MTRVAAITIHRHADASPCGFVFFGSLQAISTITETKNTTNSNSNILIMDYFPLRLLLAALLAALLVLELNFGQVGVIRYN